MTVLDSLPSESAIADKHTAFLAEIAAYNQEAMLLTAASAIITKTGQDLDNLLSAGTENLSREDQASYLKTLKQFEGFIEEFKRRVTAQIARERALKAKARKLRATIDFHNLPGNN